MQRFYVRNVNDDIYIWNDTQLLLATFPHLSPNPPRCEWHSKNWKFKQSYISSQIMAHIIEGLCL